MKKFAFLFFLLAALGLSCQKAPDAKIFDVGAYKVYVLKDAGFEGKKELLVGASDDMLKQYVPNGTFPMTVNCIVAQSAEKTILIDSGTGASIVKNLAGIKIDPAKVDAVLITHMHFDHIGGLLKDGKAVFPNADIYISRLEHQYWTSEKELANAVKANKDAGNNFKLAAEVVKVYGPKLKLFVPNELDKIKDSLLTGISPIAAYGHTPGHTIFLIESNNEKLMVWGDLAHAMFIQMPYPEVAMQFDIDSKEAIAARQKVLKYVSDNKIPVAGMHILSPGAGTLAAEGKGYSFTPLK